MRGETELEPWGNASIYSQTVVGKQRRKQRGRRIQEIVLLEKLRERENVKYHQVHLHWVLPKYYFAQCGPLQLSSFEMASLKHSHLSLLIFLHSAYTSCSTVQRTCVGLQACSA